MSQGGLQGEQVGLSASSCDVTGCRGPNPALGQGRPFRLRLGSGCPSLGSCHVRSCDALWFRAGPQGWHLHTGGVSCSLRSGLAGRQATALVTLTRPESLPERAVPARALAVSPGLCRRCDE